MGVMLREIDICTNNANWNPEFVVDQELTRKSLRVKDLGVFLNFGAEEEVLFSKFRGNLHSANAENDFLRMECRYDTDRPDGILNNNYLINRFSLEARLTINKNPNNLKPQLDGRLVFGGLVGEEAKFEA